MVKAYRHLYIEMVGLLADPEMLSSSVVLALSESVAQFIYSERFTSERKISY